VIAAIRAAGITTPISIDTRKAKVAQAALQAGADMVNDVSALRFDPDMAAVVADAGCPVCLMHSQGLPEDMQDNPSYADVVFDVFDHLAERVSVAQTAGIAAQNIITDPGMRLGGSVAVALHGAAQGAHILRVHDVKETKQALDLQMALSGASDYG